MSGRDAFVRGRKKSTVPGRDGGADNVPCTPLSVFTDLLLLFMPLQGGRAEQASRGVAEPVNPSLDDRLPSGRCWKPGTSKRMDCGDKWT